MRKLTFAIVALFAFVTIFTTTSCKPFHEEKYIDVKPNQTAFVIPLEVGTSNQKALKSLEFLKQHQIAAKRIQVPTVWHQTGRGNTGEWIPTVTVILVDRTPITREWTGDAGSGTSKSNQEIVVESRNSIGFGVNITCTASIPEETTATYQYWYGGKTLGQVMDDNVRSFIQDILTTGFGKRDLISCQNERTEVFKTMKDSTIAFFEQRGIRLDNIGAAGEFHYLNPEIQAAVNTEFIAQKKYDASIKEVAAAKQYALASEAIKAQKQLDADINIKNAFADALRAGHITTPNTVVMGGTNTSLMDVWGIKNIGGK